MRAVELLCRAHSLGANLWAEGERLELDAPADFPDELIDLLREHKAAVLAYLSRDEHRPVTPEISSLLAWASELAEQELEFTTPVNYVEAPRRKVTTMRVSWYAAHYLKTIVAARLYQQHPKLCWGLWTPQWWQEREREALGALAALREALAQRESTGRAPA